MIWCGIKGGPKFYTKNFDYVLQAIKDGYMIERLADKSNIYRGK